MLTFNLVIGSYFVTGYSPSSTTTLSAITLAPISMAPFVSRNFEKVRNFNRVQ